MNDLATLSVLIQHEIEDAGARLRAADARMSVADAAYQRGRRDGLEVIGRLVRQAMDATRLPELPRDWPIVSEVNPAEQEV